MLHSYDYAVIRVTPNLERGECINVGVVLYCRTKRYLVAHTYLDALRLHAIDAHADAASLSDQLALYTAIAAAQPEAGPIAKLPHAERFHWLVAPRSTILAAGPVHSGVCSDPSKQADALFQRLVH
ncbi:MAG: hypothetical protein RLY87_76 [Chloroflexota bacterium]|jgi:hypothetical protein